MSRVTDLNCHEFKFNPKLSAERYDRAVSFLGEKIITNLLCFCLYVLGMTRKDIAIILSIPANTVRSKLKRFFMGGTPAHNLHADSKKKTVDNQDPPKQVDVTVRELDGITSINLNNISINIPSSNNLQLKTILLSIADNRSISKSEASKHLNISPSQVGNLCRALHEKDIHGLIDNRKGQTVNYRVTEDVISEVITQFAFNTCLGQSTSSTVIAEDIKQRANINISPRSIRVHMAKLGLSGTNSILKQLLSDQKKNSKI